MKQGRLFSTPRKLVSKRRSIFDEQNLAAAQIILEDADKYGADAAMPERDALLVQWAREVVEKNNARSEDRPASG
jgi:hypothetical protein